METELQITHTYVHTKHTYKPAVPFIEPTRLCQVAIVAGFGTLQQNQFFVYKQFLIYFHTLRSLEECERVYFVLLCSMSGRFINSLHLPVRYSCFSLHLSTHERYKCRKINIQCVV